MIKSCDEHENRLRQIFLSTTTGSAPNVEAYNAHSDLNLYRGRLQRIHMNMIRSAKAEEAMT